MAAFSLSCGPTYQKYGTFAAMHFMRLWMVGLTCLRNCRRLRTMTDTTKSKRTGIAHLVGAARYSFQGLRRLSSETAFRHEAFVASVLVSAMIAVRVGLTDFFLGFALLLGIFAAEAINTAVEEIADLVSPEYSVAVKNAKDLGSLMVALSIIAACGFCGAVIAGRLLA